MTTRQKIYSYTKSYEIKKNFTLIPLTLSILQTGNISNKKKESEKTSPIILQDSENYIIWRSYTLRKLQQKGYK